MAPSFIPFELVSETNYFHLEARAFKMNSFTPTSSPPSLQLPINGSIADFNFDTSCSSNGTTATSTPVSDNGNYTNKFISEKTTMLRSNRADTEDLDNYLVRELLFTMKIQDIYVD